MIWWILYSNYSHFKQLQEGANTPSHEHPVAGFEINSIETIVIEDSSDRLREICEVYYVLYYTVIYLSTNFDVLGIILMI